MWTHLVFVGLALCHPSSTQNFEDSPKFFAKFMHPWCEWYLTIQFLSHMKQWSPLERPVSYCWLGKITAADCENNVKCINTLWAKTKSFSNVKGDEALSPFHFTVLNQSLQGLPTWLIYHAKIRLTLSKTSYEVCSSAGNSLSPHSHFLSVRLGFVAVPAFLRNLLPLLSSFLYIGLHTVGPSKTSALIYQTTTHSTTQHHFPKNLNSKNFLLPECLTKDVHLHYSNILNIKDDKHMWQAKKPTDLAQLLHLTLNKIPVCNTVYIWVTQGNHDVHLLSIKI